MDCGQAEIVPEYRFDVFYSSARLHCYHYCGVYCGKTNNPVPSSVRIANIGFGSCHLFRVLPGIHPYHASRSRARTSKKQEKNISRGTWRKAVWLYWWVNHPPHCRVAPGEFYGGRSSSVALSAWVYALVSPHYKNSNHSDYHSDQLIILHHSVQSDLLVNKKLSKCSTSATG